MKETDTGRVSEFCLVVYSVVLLRLINIDLLTNRALIVFNSTEHNAAASVSRLFQKKTG